MRQLDEDNLRKGENGGIIVSDLEEETELKEIIILY